MRVIHVNTSSSWGGLEQYTLYVMHRLRQANVDIEGMFLPGTRLYAQAKDAGFRVIDAVRSAHVSSADIKRLRKELGPNTVVHTHMRKDVWLASIACIGTQAAHVYMSQMVPAPKKDPWHTFIYRNIHAIHNTSPTHTNAIRAKWPVKHERVHQFGHMRDPSVYMRDEQMRASIRTDLGIHDDTIVIGMLTRIDPQKGVREFVDAIELLPQDVRRNVKFMLVGEPSIQSMASDGSPVYEESSRVLDDEITNRLKNNPELASTLIKLPFHPRPAEMMSAFDAFVLATYGEMYAFTVLEAMMCKCAVLGANAGGTPDQVGTDRGILFEARSAQAIADAVSTFVRDPGLRQRCVDNAYTWVMAEHSDEKVLPKYIDLYKHVVRMRTR